MRTSRGWWRLRVSTMTLKQRDWASRRNKKKRFELYFMYWIGIRSGLFFYIPVRFLFFARRVTVVYALQWLVDFQSAHIIIFSGCKRQYEWEKRNMYNPRTQHTTAKRAFFPYWKRSRNTWVYRSVHVNSVHVEKAPKKKNTNIALLRDCVSVVGVCRTMHGACVTKKLAPPFDSHKIFSRKIVEEKSTQTHTRTHTHTHTHVHSAIATTRTHKNINASAWGEKEIQASAYTAHIRYVARIVCVYIWRHSFSSPAHWLRFVLRMRIFRRSKNRAGHCPTSNMRIFAYRLLFTAPKI